jgi:hypothetical protein
MSSEPKSAKFTADAPVNDLEPELAEAISSYLRAKERSFRIVRTFDSEPLKTALFCVRYDRDTVLWYDADEFVLTDEDVAQLRSLADAVDRASERTRSATQASFQRAYDDEDAARETFRRKKNELIATRVQEQPGAAIRVIYETDEGAGRYDRNDRVFFVTSNGKVVHVVDTEDFRLRKPDEPKRNDDRYRALQAWREFMRPDEAAK